MTDRTHIRNHFPDISKAQYAVTPIVLETAAKAGVSRGELELAFVYVSQLNHCAYCTNVHLDLAKEFYSKQEGLSVEDVAQKAALTSGWRDSGDVYSDTERAYLEIAEAVTLVANQRMDDETYARLRDALGEDKLTAVIQGCINMNVFNRIHLFSHTRVGEP